MYYYGEPTTKNVYLDVFGVDPTAAPGWKRARRCHMTDGNGNEVLEGYYTKETRAHLVKEYESKGYIVFVTEHNPPRQPRAKKVILDFDFDAAIKEIDRVIAKELKGGGK